MASEGAWQSADYILLGDRPYVGADDPLRFHEQAEDLASLVLASRASTPFVLGIEAPWGMGKSTMLGLLERRLAREQSVTTVIFNAWTADGSGALEGLVKTVLDEIGGSTLRRVLRDERLRTGARLATSVIGGLLGIGNVIDATWERAVGDPRARNELQKLVEKAVESWAQKHDQIASDRMLCVFVDDLDRCSPDGVLEVFEAMKLYLSVPRLVFVVGYDQGIVSDLVLRKKCYSDAIKSRDYLEKFIQIVYRIRWAKREHAEALVSELLRSSRTEELFADAERSLLIERNQFNPRRIKRFINAFVLAYGRDNRWRRFAPQSLVRVQLLQMYFEDFARLLQDGSHPDPIDELLQYRAAREELRSGVVGKASQRMLRSHGLTPSVKDGASECRSLLGDLEQNLPIDFIPLASDDDFVSLARSLHDDPGWRDIRAALAEGFLEPVPRGGDRKHAIVELPIEGRLDDLKVLWVDDQTERVRRYVEALAEAGAFVYLVEDTETVERELGWRDFDVLVSDIMRGTDEEAGFTGLQQLREQKLAPERVAFFTSRITPARLRRARELDAMITADPRDLGVFLASAARQTGAASTGDGNV